MAVTTLAQSSSLPKVQILNVSVVVLIGDRSQLSAVQLRLCGLLIDTDNTGSVTANLQSTVSN